MTGHADRLEQAGLIARVPSDTDRRRVGLHVTPAGEKVLRAVRSRRTAWLAQRLQGLAPDELRAIDDAIEPLMKLLDEEERR